MERFKKAIIQTHDYLFWTNPLDAPIDMDNFKDDESEEAEEEKFSPKTPVKATSTKTTPIKASSTKSTPTKTTPTKSSPKKLVIEDDDEDQ